MKKKKIILPIVYMSLIVASFFSITAIGSFLSNTDVKYDYSKPILKEVTQKVLSDSTNKFIKPFISDSVSLVTSYYDKDTDEQSQIKSIISFEKTYMPSTGNLYTSLDSFDVIAVYDGKVTNVFDDNILGNVVEITHNTNLVTYYYSLEDILVNKDDTVKQGTIIGKGGMSKLSNDYSLFFEVFYDGKSMNPEVFYETNPDELQ